MYEEDKNFPNIILVLFTSVMFLCLTIVGIFFVGVVKVDAASYDFAIPRTHNICPSNLIGYCGPNQGGIVVTDSRTIGSLDNQAKGNYINVNYRADMNTTNVSGSTYIAGKYQVEFRYRIYFISGTDISTDKIKAKLTYYPNDSEQYGIATCDGEEKVTVTKGWYIEDSSFRTYDIHYTCSTLQITEGKQFLGWHIEIDNSDDPFGLTKYIQYGEVEQNLKLIGEGEASNNDIINNQNQNTQDIINNQNQNTDKITDSLDKNTEEQKETNDTLKDSDTTGAQDTAGGFFDSFTTEDNGGISGIITAPLVAINQMLSETCVDLTGSYKGKEFSIPNGCEFWSKIPEVKNFLNVIEGGLLCYLIIRKMFYLVQRLKNPEDDRVEVMSL